MAFNINAQVILSGPKNIRAVTKRIKSELSSVSVPVNIKIDKSTSKNLGTFNRGIKQLTTNLNLLRTSSTAADTSIRNLVAGLGTLSSISTKVSTAHAHVASSVKRSGQEIAVARNELQEFGKDAALAIRRFTAFTVATTVVFGFVRAIGKATGAALDYEREIVKIVQVTGAGAAKIGQLKQSIDDLSVSLGVDANELASLSRIFAQTGQSIDQVRASIRSVARSSLAPSFGEMKGTAEGLIAAMNQFNIAADQSEQVLGALNAVSKKFAVESEDLVSVIRRAGGVFSTSAGQMKEPQQALNELIGLFTAVRSTTRESADTIATGLRTIFTRIQRKGTIEFLRQFNIELLDAKGHFVGLFPAFQKLSAGLKGLVQSGDAVKLSAITEELGGIRQVGKLIPTIVNFNKALAATKVAAQGAAEGLGGDVALALQPLGKQFEQLGARFNSLIRTISESKTFQNLAKVAISTANAFLSVAEALTPLIPLITTLATIKITRGLFQFGQGFVGGLKKGRGVEAAGGTVGTFVGGGAGRGAPAPKPTGGEKILATAVRENIASVRLNTTGLNKVAGILTQSSVSFTTSTTNLITSNVNLVASIGNLIGALNRNAANRGLGGGFRPPKKFARGGVVRGPSHAQGGVLAELEGGERVIPRGYPTGGGVGRLRPDEVSALRRELSVERRAAKGGGPFSGKTTAGGKGIIIDPRRETKGLSPKEAKLFKEVAAIPDSPDVETFGGAFLDAPGQSTKLKGQVRGDVIQGALSQSKLFQVSKGARRNSELQGVFSQVRSQMGKKKDFNLIAESLLPNLSEAVEDAILSEVVSGIQLGSGQLASQTRMTQDKTQVGRILKATNIDNVIGNIYEAILLNAGVPYSEKDRDAANAPFDFPVGLGSVATSFTGGQLGKIPTDAKTRYTNANVSTFLTKARDRERDRLERLLADAFDSYATEADLLGQFPAARDKQAGDSSRSQARALFGERALRRAAGGPIFSPRGTDTVPAMLTPGEYVINRGSAQAIGYGQLDKMNRLAAGGKVKYLNGGGRTGPTGTVATTQRGSGLEGATGTLVDRFGMAAVAVTGLTAAIASLDFSSMQSALVSAGSLALTFAQLQFFLGAETLSRLGGVLKALPGVSDFTGAFGKGVRGFNLPHLARGSAAAGSPQLLTGFSGFLAKSTTGLKSFTRAIGGLSGFFKGLPGLILSFIAAPIIDAGIDQLFGKAEEISSGVFGRKGRTAAEAGGIGALGGAAKGALTGGAIASLIPIPVISTAIGAGVGAAVGGLLGAYRAAEDQRVFNTFEKIQRAGDRLTKSFDLIDKSAGRLGRGEQAAFERDISRFQSTLSDASVTLRDFVRDRRREQVQTPERQAQEEFGEGWQRFFDTLDFDAGVPGEGAGLKAIEERRNFFSSEKNREAFTRGQESLDQNAAALATFLDLKGSQRIADLQISDPSDDLRTAQSVDAIRRLSQDITEGRGDVRGVRPLPEGFIKELEAGDSIAAFNTINEELTRMAAAGNESAASLKRIRDQRLFFAIQEAVEEESKEFQKQGETVKQSALNIGIALLGEEMDLTKISEGDLRKALTKVVAETQARSDITEEEANVIRKVILEQVNLSAERGKEVGLLSITNSLLVESQKSIQLFSLEIQRLGDAADNAAADFGLAINNIITTIQGVKDGPVSQPDLLGRFTGTDKQFDLIEQGAPRAVELRNLRNLEGQLPNILEKTLKAAQKKEAAEVAAGRKEGLTPSTVNKILKTQLRIVAGGNTPDAIFKQIRKSIGGGTREGGPSDPVRRLEEILATGAEDVSGFSGVLTQGSEVAEKAFEDIKKIFSDYARVIQEGIALEEKTIQSRLQLLNQYDQAEDRLRTARGGRQNITVEEARLRRTRRIQTTLGLDPGPDAANVAPKGIEGGEKSFLPYAKDFWHSRESCNAVF